MKTHIKIHPSILLISLFPVFGIADTAMTALLWLSAAMHEAGHMLAAKRCGVFFRQITILPIGIAALPGETWKISPQKEIIIAAAGPAVNLAAALLTLTLPLPANQYAVGFLYYHLAQFYINLLPILPLDGGRILYYTLARKHDGDSCEKICFYCGIILLCLSFFPSAIILIFGRNPSFLLVWFYLALYTGQKKGAI